MQWMPIAAVEWMICLRFKANGWPEQEVLHDPFDMWDSPENLDGYVFIECTPGYWCVDYFGCRRRLDGNLVGPLFE
jgi:hypothetical protein